MTNNPVPEAPPPGTPAPEKKMHGCMIALLVVIIIFNALGLIGVAMLAIGNSFIGLNLDLPTWNITVSIIVNVLAIAFAILLLMWKKIGFWGLVTLEVVNVIVGIIGGNYFAIVGGVIAVGLLFWVLNIGGPRKAWPQLE